MKHIQTIKAPFAVSLRLPSSKSITLRDAVLASLANGPSILEFPAECDDFSRMAHALVELGIEISQLGAEKLQIAGTGGRFRPGSVQLEAGLSGTAARFLIALALLRRDQTTIDGLPPLRVRPNQSLLEALANLGAMIEAPANGGLPVAIRGPEVCQASIQVKGDQSSQYLSALLLIGPLLPEGLELSVLGELVSRPYVEITLREMLRFGVTVERDGYRRFRVPHEPYVPAHVRLEGDASAASYHAALATIHGGSVTFANLGKSTAQGDYRFLEICEMVGATVARDDEATTVTGPAGGRLRPLEGDVNLEAMPDTALTLFAMAPFIPGGAQITGLKTLRIKECDRISVPARELQKLGVPTQEGPDYLVVGELPSHREAHPVRIETHDDHRIAMSFAVLGTKVGNIQIEDPACVGKSYPTFWDDLKLYG
jgi:3-phosphoshikimate 1-carboxyvinyltransferase